MSLTNAVMVCEFKGRASKTSLIRRLLSDPDIVSLDNHINTHCKRCLNESVEVSMIVGVGLSVVSRWTKTYPSNLGSRAASDSRL